MKIGEKHRVTPLLGHNDKSIYNVPMVGTIIWIHPKGRFALLEFECLNGKGRECFYPEALKQPIRERRGK